MPGSPEAGPDNLIGDSASGAASGGGLGVRPGRWKGGVWSWSFAMVGWMNHTLPIDTDQGL
jgi:hypothetical protein